MNLLRNSFLAAMLAGSMAVTAIESNVSGDELPVIPATPSAVNEVVLIQPFTLAKGEAHRWSAEQITMTSGYVVVLKVAERDLLIPRQIAQPVLYFGNQTAERFNVGYESGYVIAFVPAELEDAKSERFIDLQTARAFFGTPMLPEQVDHATIQSEVNLAASRGIEPIGQAKAQQALARGAERLSLGDKNDLIEYAVGLVEQYSPQETLLIEQHRLGDEVIVEHHGR